MNCPMKFGMCFGENNAIKTKHIDSEYIECDKENCAWWVSGWKKIPGKPVKTKDGISRTPYSLEEDTACALKVLAEK